MAHLNKLLKAFLLTVAFLGGAIPFTCKTSLSIPIMKYFPTKRLLVAT